MDDEEVDEQKTAEKHQYQNCFEVLEQQCLDSRKPLVALLGPGESGFQTADSRGWIRSERRGGQEPFATLHLRPTCLVHNAFPFGYSLRSVPKNTAVSPQRRVSLVTNRNR